MWAWTEAEPLSVCGLSLKHSYQGVARNPFADDPVVLAVLIFCTQTHPPSVSGQGDSEISGNNGLVLHRSLESITYGILDATFHLLPGKPTNEILLLGICRETFLIFLLLFSLELLCSP